MNNGKKYKTAFVCEIKQKQFFVTQKGLGQQVTKGRVSDVRHSKMKITAFTSCI